MHLTAGELAVEIDADHPVDDLVARALTALALVREQDPPPRTGPAGFAHVERSPDQ